MAKQHSMWTQLLGTGLLSLALSSCGGGAAPATTAVPASPATGIGGTLAAQLPAPLDHAPSGITSTFRNGASAFQHSALAQQQGGSLLLGPEASGTAFGVYNFNVNNVGRSVDVTLDPQQTSGAAWFGVANYARGTWMFSGPYTESHRVELDPGHVFAPHENISVAIVAEPGATVKIDGLQLNADNQLLQASFVNTTTDAHLPVTVNFDASASSDYGGGITRYEWDLDGDGSYEVDAGAEPKILHTYSAAGPVAVGLRVTDDAGLSTVTTHIVPIHDWQTADPGVADLPAGGNYSSLANVGGHPAICYYSFDLKTLLYVRSDDAEGTAWGTPVVVDARGDNCGYSNCLALIGGVPQISYLDQTTDSLMFVAASDSLGAQWQVPRWLAEAAGPDRGTSLCAINGQPAIAYQDLQAHARYIRAKDGQGSAWYPSVLVDAADLTGYYGSLAQLNGAVGLAYQRSDKGVWFASSSDSYGNAWHAPQQVDASGKYPALAAIDGKPALAYYGYFIGNGVARLYVRLATDVPGSAWQTGVTVDNHVSATNVPPVLRIIDGLPCVGYYDVAEQQLRYCQGTDGTGLVWQSPLVLDTGGSLNANLSLSMFGSSVGISYYDSNSGLRFIRTK